MCVRTFWQVDFRDIPRFEVFNREESVTPPSADPSVINCKPFVAEYTVCGRTRMVFTHFENRKKAIPRDLWALKAVALPHSHLYLGICSIKREVEASSSYILSMHTIYYEVFIIWQHYLVRCNFVLTSLLVRMHYARASTDLSAQLWNSLTITKNQRTDRKPRRPRSKLHLLVGLSKKSSSM